MKLKDNTLAYGYIDSNAIREYNQKINTYFSPMEQAVLVYHSKRISVEQKITIWTELLNSFTTEEFQEGMYIVHKPGRMNKNLVEYTLQTFIRVMQSSKQEAGKQENVIYEARFWECDYPDDVNVSKGYFTRFSEANQFLQNKKEKFLKDRDLRDVKVRGEIVCVDLNEEYSREGDIYQYNNEMKLINIFPQTSKFEVCGLYSIYMNIPIPFTKGDLVKTIGLEKECYGVVNHDYTEIKFNSADIWKDATDMYCCVDVCWNSDWDSRNLFGWAMYEYLDLEYCNQEDLPEDQKMLISISEAYHGKISLGMLCRECVLGRIE